MAGARAASSSSTNRRAASTSAPRRNLRADRPAGRVRRRHLDDLQRHGRGPGHERPDRGLARRPAGRANSARREFNEEAVMRLATGTLPRQAEWHYDRNVLNSDRLCARPARPRLRRAVPARPHLRRCVFLDVDYATLLEQPKEVLNSAGVLRRADAGRRRADPVGRHRPVDRLVVGLSGVAFRVLMKNGVSPYVAAAGRAGPRPPSLG